MSDIQELIHKTSMDCIDKGKRLEQERIIKLLEDTIRKSIQELNVVDGNWYPAALKMRNDLANFIALIKGEK